SAIVMSKKVLTVSSYLIGARARTTVAAGAVSRVAQPGNTTLAMAMAMAVAVAVAVVLIGFPHASDSAAHGDAPFSHNLLVLPRADSFRSRPIWHAGTESALGIAAIACVRAGRQRSVASRGAHGSGGRQRLHGFRSVERMNRTVA